MENSATCNELIAFREWADADDEQAYGGQAAPAETPPLQVFTEQRTLDSGL